MLTTFGADESLYAALRAGTSGFLLKVSPPERLVGAIKTDSRSSPQVPGSTRVAVSWKSGETISAAPIAARRKARASDSFNIGVSSGRI
ncbi:response regulator [Planotetraspora mira]|uniref:Response regulator transcription factor n=1 Tax=Planotetraspora mira TaxID=58121 RepID=A0A8J3TKR8_9ACTN|nr:hypothetical protein [Planotetraspora mira]GII26952.1 hypothetical protein Pmi06nite_03940 [Planotetraspora mira]